MASTAQVPQRSKGAHLWCRWCAALVADSWTSRTDLRRWFTGGQGVQNSQYYILYKTFIGLSAAPLW